MARQYFTLLVREPGHQWSPQFGDYSRAVVLYERNDMQTMVEVTIPKGTEFKIIKTHDGQACIDKAVAEVNAAVSQEIFQ